VHRERERVRVCQESSFCDSCFVCDGSTRVGVLHNSATFALSNAVLLRLRRFAKKVLQYKTLPLTAVANLKRERERKEERL